ncbi:MAG: hypothetical protein ACLTMD_08445 [Clostridium sp.]
MTIYRERARESVFRGWCYSCPGAIDSCLRTHRTPWRPWTEAALYILGTLLLLGVTLGRLICGFLCPLD